VSDSLKRIRS